MTDAPDAARPNILFIMADQLSALATSPYGNRDVQTPYLQNLVQRGVVFERSYCNSPLCAPSRGSMMAGQLSGRLPVNDNSEELPASVPTFVHHLRHAGYHTILSGKMHYVGPDQLHGFEERLTTDIYPADYMWTKTWESQGDPPRRVGLPGDAETGASYARQMAQMVKESGPVSWSYQHEYDEETHHRALESLRGLVRRRGPEAQRPWFLCVSYTHPHDPYVNTQAYWDRYEGVELAMPEAPPPGYEPHVSDVWANSYHGVDTVAPTAQDVYRSRRGYYASTSYVDDKVGHLVGELERLGLAGDTVVLFTADHGDMLGEHGMWFKRTVRERSARVPLIVAGAGIAEGERVGQNVSLVDLYPTMLDLAGVALPADLPHSLDGASLAPFLLNRRSLSQGGPSAFSGPRHRERAPSEPSPATAGGGPDAGGARSQGAGDDGAASPEGWKDEAIVENNGEATIKPIRALVKGRYKLIYVHERPDQLYDLAADPNEWRNLAGDIAYAGVVERLRARLMDGWDAAETERRVLASQHLRAFLKESLFQGRYTSWDFQPFFDATREYVRRESNRQWDPDLGR